MHIYSTNNEADGQAFVLFASKESATPGYRPVLVYTLSPPAAPTALAVAPEGSAGAMLAWAATPDATSYNVLRSTTSGGGYEIVGSGITATNFTDASVSNGGTYYYVVQAVNAGGPSANSSEVAVMIAGATDTPAMPVWGLVALAFGLVVAQRSRTRAA